eukprot:15434260-Alexandrium_andersonii.AAC.1
MRRGHRNLSEALPVAGGFGKRAAMPQHCVVARVVQHYTKQRRLAIRRRVRSWARGNTEHTHGRAEPHLA